VLSAKLCARSGRGDAMSANRGLNPVPFMQDGCFSVIMPCILPVWGRLKLGEPTSFPIASCLQLRSPRVVAYP
jgi:hypothetical protein